MSTDDASIEQRRADVVRSREELGAAVEQLTDKLDVKAQAHDHVEHVMNAAKDTASKLKQAAPEPVQRAVEHAGDRVGPVVDGSRQRLEPYRRQAIVGGVVLVLLLLLLRRRSHR
jgi:hypothetical protein